MKERMNKRVLASCFAILALVFGVVGGTLAFLQDSTSVIENEFTFGNIDISLTEGVVDEYGVAVVPAERTDQNQLYKLIPGHSYTKDPVVTVEADSEASYVYFVVDNPISSIEDSTAGTIASQIAANGWTELSSASYIDKVAKKATQKVYYKAVSSSDVDQELATFTTLNIAGGADVSAADSLSIDVAAYAVQQDGFSSALDAWTKTFGASWVTRGTSLLYQAQWVNDTDPGTSLQQKQTGTYYGTGFNPSTANYQALIQLNQLGFTPDVSDIEYLDGASAAINTANIQYRSVSGQQRYQYLVFQANANIAAHSGHPVRAIVHNNDKTRYAKITITVYAQQFGSRLLKSTAYSETGFPVKTMNNMKITPATDSETLEVTDYQVKANNVVIDSSAVQVRYFDSSKAFQVILNPEYESELGNSFSIAVYDSTHSNYVVLNVVLNN